MFCSSHLRFQFMQTMLLLLHPSHQHRRRRRNHPHRRILRHILRRIIRRPLQSLQLYRRLRKLRKFLHLGLSCHRRRHQPRRQSLRLLTRLLRFRFLRLLARQTMGLRRRFHPRQLLHRQLLHRRLRLRQWLR